MTRKTNNIRYWMIGKAYYTFLKTHEAISQFLYHFDAKDEHLWKFMTNSPEQLTDNDRDTVHKMYVYIRDVLDGGYGLHEAINLSHLPEETLCEIGFLDKDELEEDKAVEKILIGKIKSIYKTAKILAFNPVAGSIGFRTMQGEYGKAYLDAFSNEIEIHEAS